MTPQIIDQRHGSKRREFLRRGGALTGAALDERSDTDTQGEKLRAGGRG